MTRIVIAETGIAPGNLANSFGTYGEMMTRMIERHRPLPTIETYVVHEGDVLPDPEEGTSLLITGSPAGVYDDHDWITALQHAVRHWIGANRPVVGICFGHQLMAQAMGGKVEKSDRGWGVGVHTYDRAVDVVPWGLDLDRFSCAVSHQDQVVELPDEGTRVAGSAFCPNGVIAYTGAKAMSFQMHPEFDHAFGEALLSARHDRVPADAFELGLATYKGSTDREKISRWITDFLCEDI